MIKKTVYLVDDDKEILENIAMFLRDRFFDVRTFSCGDAFLKAFPISYPAVIVLDMHMPALSGLDLQNKLMQANSHAPIYFLSGESESQQIIDALKQGAHDFLLKPISPSVLLKTINKGFDLQAQQEEVSKIDLDNQQLLLRLTEAERSIFDYFLNGFSNKDIAEKANLKADTIKKRRAQIYMKLAVADLPALIKKFNTTINAK